MPDHRIQGRPAHAVDDGIGSLSAEALFDSHSSILDESIEVELTVVLSFAPPYGEGNSRRMSAKLYSALWVFQRKVLYFFLFLFNEIR